MTLYTLIKTNYEDDYKHRYDSGVYPYTIGVYNSRKLALEAQIKDKIKELRDYIYEHYDKRDTGEIAKEIRRYIYLGEDKQKYGYPKKKYDNNDIVDYLCVKIFKGNYVDFIYEWDIKFINQKI